MTEQFFIGKHAYPAQATRHFFATGNEIFIGKQEGVKSFLQRKMPPGDDFQRRKIKKVINTHWGKTVDNILIAAIVRYRAASIFDSTLN